MPATRRLRKLLTLSRSGRVSRTRSGLSGVWVATCYLRSNRTTPVAQVQMLSPLLDAEQLKPRSRVRHELYSLHQTGPN